MTKKYFDINECKVDTKWNTCDPLKELVTATVALKIKKKYVRGRR